MKTVTESGTVRKRLRRAAPPARRRPTMLDRIADLVGAIDGLPAGLSAGKKRHLKATGYGRKRPR
jgi:hypothetical protein